jgi:two-component system chemotaxis response regulator CheB
MPASAVPSNREPADSKSAFRSRREPGLLGPLMASGHRGERDRGAAPPLNRLVVIGAGEGGSQAVLTLAQGLAPDLAAAVLVVVHDNARHSQLPRLLSNLGLDAAFARAGERISPGRIYVSSPDEHLVVEGAALRLSRGPRENRCRPAIDPLFRSAALSHAERVVGVLLTGEADDGVAGLQAIKQLRGLVVVQEPADAFCPDMPQAALEACEVDRRLPIDAIAPYLNEVCRRRPDPPASGERPDRATLSRLRRETMISLGEGDARALVEKGGSLSPFTCPECHGGLWEMQGSRPASYRCHTGHVFTERTMEKALALVSRDALWGACRAVQERQMLLERMAQGHRARQDLATADRLDDAVAELHEQVQAVRGVLQRGPGAELEPAGSQPPGRRGASARRPTAAGRRDQGARPG